MSDAPSPVDRVAVVTLVSGRHDHLRRQRASLAQSDVPVDVHVIVAMGDDVGPVIADDGGPPVEVLHQTVEDGLPLAAARNLGAAAALRHGCGLLVFLDVDCLAGRELVSRYLRAAQARPDALLAGPVTYLPPGPAPSGATELAAARRPHAGRPDPPPGRLEPGEHRLFWSLSFAVTAPTWRHLGGFDDGYVGYGAEDTDFARTAEKLAVPLLWVGGADAFHQHHPSWSPPVQHVDAILRNGRHYAARWGDWPMTGWLRRFEADGLIRAEATGWRRAPSFRLASVPARHPFVDAVRPAPARPAVPQRVTGWDPDPLLTPAGLRRWAPDIDVLHVHFGYEHLTREQLLDWTDVLAELGLPLVVTVHDLRNPHLADNRRHEEHLEILTARADRLITLTPGAADDLRDRYGRTADVLEHPTLHPVVPEPRTTAARTVWIPLGALRASVVDPLEVVDAVLEALSDATSVELVCSVRPDRQDDPRLAGVRRRAEQGRLRLDLDPRRDEADLLDRLSGIDTLVLPYRFGTHSGWLETARDLGVRVVAPSCGHLLQQSLQAVGYSCDEDAGLRRDTLIDAVRRSLELGRPQPADRGDRLAAREVVRARHEMIYRQVTGRS